jgi:hypothetical protein
MDLPSWRPKPKLCPKPVPFGKRRQKRLTEWERKLVWSRKQFERGITAASRLLFRRAFPGKRSYNQSSGKMHIAGFMELLKYYFMNLLALRPCMATMDPFCPNGAIKPKVGL